MESDSPPGTKETKTENMFYEGRVKWFNNKAGYGFITVLNNAEFKDTDVFCHHTSIEVNLEQYRYLVQGEYVTYEIKEVNSDSHKWQATNIKGIARNKLMCETRVENRQTGPSVGGERYKSYNGAGGDYSSDFSVRNRGQGPRDNSDGFSRQGRGRNYNRGGEHEYARGN